MLGDVHPESHRICLQPTGRGGIQVPDDLVLARDPGIQPQVIMCRCDDGGHPVMQRLHYLVGRHDDDVANVWGLTTAC